MRKTLLIVALLLCFNILKSFAQTLPLFVSPPVASDNSNPGKCYNQVLNLVVPGGATNLAAINNSYFLWEYSFNQNAAPNAYQFLGTSYSSNFSFTPIISFGGIQISVSTPRYIRVRQIVGSVNAPVVIGTSLPIPIVFSPAAPVFDGAYTEILETTPSCQTTPTGTIKIPHIRYTDSILYIVKNNGDGVFCNPITNSPPCFNVIKSGKTDNLNFVITGVAAGSYTVFISNIGGSAGTCNNISLANVPMFAPIAVNGTQAFNPLCNNEINGKYLLNVSGGDSNTYKFTLTPNIGNKYFSNGKITFSNLPSGSYTASFTDTCGTIINNSFTLVNPPKVIGNIAKIEPTCALPGNGVIKVFASYNQLITGFNNFSYKLFKNGLGIDSLINTSNTNHSFSGLTGGNYKVMAYSPNLPNCSGLEETFVLGFNALTILIDSIKNMNCNGQADGYLKVKANGGTNSYLYFLRNVATGTTTIDSFGVFRNLAQGNYRAIAKNRFNGCQDSAFVTINITQPTSISVNVAKQDIQCYNNNNGSLIASATGGNGGYIYNWEKQNPVSNAWVSYFNINDTIVNLYPGIYRSKIIDAKNCPGYSLPIVINEPDSLNIDSVRVKDIPCYAGTGFINMYVSGGNAAYTYQYRLLPSTNYITFTPSTGLAAGSYLVRVVDAKNCITFYPDTLIITSPPSNLDFTYNLVDLNGYNITCFGAANGNITINAFGGNGNGYIGFKYTYDNLPWQLNNNLYNIPAGNRAIKVSDARGCIAIKNIVFTQPNDSLNVQLLASTPITCFGANTGSFTVKVLGGVRPYKFSIDGGITYQTDSIFRNLTAGSYAVIIRDFNNCLGNLLVNINNIHSNILSNATITHVTCNGLANGTIASTITGGLAPYAYNWVGTTNNTLILTNAIAGNYIQRITDAAGCVKDINFYINQPGVLTPIINTYPVCYGATTGKIIIKPVGGKAPFQYSKDNGVTYQNDSIFTNLPQAIYNLKVKDVNNCVWTGQATISVLSNNPNLNFIISSNQHANDTITMKEISWIKPDSIKWEFHPAATIIDNNRVEPKIKFNSFDTSVGYWVRLVGFYPTCSYTTQKTIKIFPYDINAAYTPANFNKGIKKAELFPNPNNGQFTLNIEFFKLQKATIYITSIQGIIIGQKVVYPPSMQILKNFTTEMNGTGPGTYILRIVSDYDSKYIMFVKQ